MKLNRRLLPVLPAMLAILFLMSAPTLAQTFRGSINGTITDPSGAVVTGENVTAIDVATAVTRETVWLSVPSAVTWSRRRHRIGAFDQDEGKNHYP